MEMNKFDFSGWATKNDLLCSDGRTIRKDAFKNNDGVKVPLVWNHEHNNPLAVLGHAVLENRPDGVYAYGKFNDSDQGKAAKKLVENGDVRSLSIWADQLKEIGKDVIHGNIRELSLVLAGANPGAYVDYAMAHGADETSSMYASWDENIMLYHSVDGNKKEEGEKNVEKENKEGGAEETKSIADVIASMNEDQKKAMYYMVTQALEENENKGGTENADGENGGSNMKHNVFDGVENKQNNALSHSDEEAIIALAKQGNVGSLQMAMQIFRDENESLSHGVFGSETEALFPEYELVKKGAPDTVERDQSWIGAAIAKISKSPISRIRTRNADARISELKAKGYGKKGNYKTETASIKLIGRTTDPQTIYIKDQMHRDDIVDITDFDVVAYQWTQMRHVLDETVALAALVGDGRDDGDPDKIHEDHIRSIWHDDEIYTIHQDVDIEAAKTALQGSDTGKNFGYNYIYAEAIITAALHSRENYKGSGTPDLYCAPHMLNVMLLARDLNGRRIYDSKSDLAKALNVNEIYTAEQLEGLTRSTSDGNTKKLLGLFVNLSDYQLGATKGGEVTRFEDFDMDFNRYKYMLETRLSGALTKLYSAIALEEDITE